MCYNKKKQLISDRRLGMLVVSSACKREMALKNRPSRFPFYLPQPKKRILLQARKIRPDVRIHPNTYPLSFWTYPLAKIGRGIIEEVCGGVASFRNMWEEKSGNKISVPFGSQIRWQRQSRGIKPTVVFRESEIPLSWVNLGRVKEERLFVLWKQLDTQRKVNASSKAYGHITLKHLFLRDHRR